MLASKLIYFSNEVKEVGVYLNLRAPLLENFKTVFNTDWGHVYFVSSASELVFIEMVGDIDFFFEDIKLRQPRLKMCVFNFDDLRLLFLIKDIARTFKYFVAYINYQGAQEEKRSLARILQNKKIAAVWEDNDFGNLSGDWSRYFQPRQLRLI